MTAVATLSTAAATDVPSLRTVGKVLLAIAVGVWFLVIAELAARKVAN
ncbi:hypothetical protein HLB23_36055 [Nocardia uniformis]|uniref:Uncharacterized protein n=1 Tax=Nocardia uniformis TaxID=53432 RepID=A0A849CBI0_9NOCA|nr:hypothetical protein [Nocardia uniformis]NNH75206.1 hypothetical protein [Nocardia uniformis]